MILAHVDERNVTKLRQLEQEFIYEFDAKNPSIGLNGATAYVCGSKKSAKRIK